jgi:hypothetical protein
LKSVSDNNLPKRGSICLVSTGYYGFSSTYPLDALSCSSNF